MLIHSLQGSVIPFPDPSVSWSSCSVSRSISPPTASASVPQAGMFTTFGMFCNTADANWNAKHARTLMTEVSKAVAELSSAEVITVENCESTLRALLLQAGAAWMMDCGGTFFTMMSQLMNFRANTTGLDLFETEILSAYGKFGDLKYVLNKRLITLLAPHAPRLRKHSIPGTQSCSSQVWSAVRK